MTTLTSLCRQQHKNNNVTDPFRLPGLHSEEITLEHMRVDTSASSPCATSWDVRASTVATYGVGELFQFPRHS